MDSLGSVSTFDQERTIHDGSSASARRNAWRLALPSLAAALLWFAVSGTAQAQSITSTFTNGYTFTGTGGTPTLEAIYAIGGDGSIAVSPENCWGGCGQSSIGNWLSPTTGMSNYEFRATNGGCPYALGTFGVWMTAGVGTGWGVYISDINQSAVCSIGVSVRSKSNPSVVIATATINFNVWTGT